MITSTAHRAAARCLGALILLSAAHAARADTIPDWNLITAKALQTAKAGTGLAHSRVYAIVHGAMFDAVNAIERRYHSYAADLKAAPGASQEAAAAAAAHTVLAELYPLQKETLDAALAASLARVQDGPAKADGAALGKAAAEKMLALRRNDKMSENVSYAPKSGPGAFQLPANANPIGPHWGSVTPFTLKSIEDFRLPGPPALTSARYAQDFNEVKTVGAKNSTQRTAEQTAIATLWEPTSPLTYNAALRAMPELKQKSIIEQARVFALLNMAGSDALIVGWRDKYLILFWRPETAIRNADSDGNDATSQQIPPGRACVHRSLRTRNIPPAMHSSRARPRRCCAIFSVPTGRLLRLSIRMRKSHELSRAFLRWRRAWKTRASGQGFISAAPTLMAPKWVGGLRSTP